MAKVIVVTREYEVVEAETQTFYLTEEDVERYVTETGNTIEDERELFAWCYEQGMDSSYDCKGQRVETDLPNTYTVEIGGN